MRISLIVVLLCGALFACRKSAAPDNAKPVALPATGQEVVAAENQFTVTLFQQLEGLDTSLHNKMVSPLSIYLALGMANLGAAGTTRDSLLATMDLGSSSTGDLNNTALALMTQLPGADPEVTLSIANSVWSNENLPLLPSYLQAVQQYYGAKAEALDFSSPSAAQTINQWVNAETRQMIPSIISATNPSELAILVNAVFFKGSWTYGFDPGATKDMPFTRGDGVVESVPMMSLPKAGAFPFHGDTVTITELPYGAGNFAMYAIMPNGTLGIRGLLSMLTPARVAYWLQNMDTTNIQLYFPKFTFDYNADSIMSCLSKMGMGIAFSTAADFSNLSSTPSLISQVIHKTSIQVDESGAKAAAATGIVSVGLVEGGSPTSIYYNQPFVFLITEKTSGVILFAGVLNDPLSGGN